MIFDKLVDILLSIFGCVLCLIVYILNVNER